MNIKQIFFAKQGISNEKLPSTILIHQIAFLIFEIGPRKNFIAQAGFFYLN
jgi:hypothetical protein